MADDEVTVDGIRMRATDQATYTWFRDWLVAETDMTTAVPAAMDIHLSEDTQGREAQHMYAAHTALVDRIVLALRRLGQLAPALFARLGPAGKAALNVGGTAWLEDVNGLIAQLQDDDDDLTDADINVSFLQQLWVYFGAASLERVRQTVKRPGHGVKRQRDENEAIAAHIDALRMHQRRRIDELLAAAAEQHALPNEMYTAIAQFLPARTALRLLMRTSRALLETYGVTAAAALIQRDFLSPQVLLLADLDAVDPASVGQARALVAGVMTHVQRDAGWARTDLRHVYMEWLMTGTLSPHMPMFTVQTATEGTTMLAALMEPEDGFVADISRVLEHWIASGRPLIELFYTTMALTLAAPLSHYAGRAGETAPVLVGASGLHLAYVWDEEMHVPQWRLHRPPADPTLAVEVAQRVAAQNARTRQDPVQIERWLLNNVRELVDVLVPFVAWLLVQIDPSLTLVAPCVRAVTLGGAPSPVGIPQHLTLFGQPQVTRLRMPSVRLASLRYGPAYLLAVEPAYPEPRLNVVAGQPLTPMGPLPLVAAIMEGNLYWKETLKKLAPPPPPR
jgi:hypothetical protein